MPGPRVGLNGSWTYPTSSDAPIIWPTQVEPERWIPVTRIGRRSRCSFMRISSGSPATDPLDSSTGARRPAARDLRRRRDVAELDAAVRHVRRRRDERALHDGAGRASVIDGRLRDVGAGVDSARLDHATLNVVALDVRDVERADERAAPELDHVSRRLLLRVPQPARAGDREAEVRRAREHL